MRFKLGRFFLFGITSALLLTFLCGAQKTGTVTDMLGRKVEVPEPLTRVALLGGPTGQIAYILGAREQLCAVTKSLKTSELVKMMDPTAANLAAPRSVSGQVNVDGVDVRVVREGNAVERKVCFPILNKV